MIEHTDPQGSEAWHESRRGVVTASRAKDARDRTTGLDAKQTAYVEAILAGRAESEAKALAGYKATPSAEAIRTAIASGRIEKQWTGAAIAYAKDLARERCGGKSFDARQGLAQRAGHEEEPFAAIAYVAETGMLVDDVGFITTDDRLFGCSLDRRVRGVNGAIEIKTMVSSTTLFASLVDGDISEFRDQCLFEMWLLMLDWVDLCLWAPDLQKLIVIRIERDEDEIAALEFDMVEFNRLVGTYADALRRKLGQPNAVATAPPDPISGKPARTPDDPAPSPPARAAASTTLLPDELPF